MRQAWVSRALSVFVMAGAVQLLEAQTDTAGPQRSARVRLYEDATGKIVADPASVRVFGDGSSTVTFYGDKIGVVIRFQTNKVCNTTTLQGNSNVDVTCKVPARCIKNASGTKHDSCGHHAYTVKKLRKGATAADPEIVIDEGLNR